MAPVSKSPTNWEREMWQGLIAMILAAITVFGFILAEPEGDDVFATDIQVIAQETAQETETREWAEFNELARIEYEDLFTTLFEATQVKWSKNGRLMVKGVDSKSFKFAKRA
jgi:hypothetical protein